MPSGERRSALGGAKAARPHPAEPAATAPRPTPREAAGEGGTVMLCVRVPPSLRRRLKLASATSGESVQVLVTDALEGICRQHDL